MDDGQKTTYFIGRNINLQGAKSPLVILPGEKESDRDARWNSLQESWHAYHQAFRDIQRNATDTSTIIEFIQSYSPTGGRLATGLLMAGPDIANHHRVIELIRSNMADSVPGSSLITLNSHDCTSLKSCLQSVVKAVAPDQKEFSVYDLDAVAQECQKNEDKHTRIVVLIEDAVTFNSAILAQFIGLLHSYSDRVPFMILLNIATSIEVFQTKLPQSCVRLLDSHSFNSSADTQSICLDMLHVLLDHWLVSSGVYEELLKQAEIAGDMFINSVQYVLMAHFYSRPLTPSAGVIRSLASFRNHVEALVKQGDMNKARDLLQSDQEVLTFFKEAANNFQNYHRRVIAFTDLCDYLFLQIFSTPDYKQRNTCYLATINGETTQDVLASHADEFDADSYQLFLQYSSQLQGSGIEVPLDSQFDISKARDFLMTIPETFGVVNNPLKDQLLYEFFALENSGMMKSAMQADVRGKMEEALSQSCFNHEPHLLSLYQLYRESPAVINTNDYYYAFHEVVGDDEDESKTLAWFLQGIAELKLMGFVKDVRRQYETLEKLLWKGL